MRNISAEFELITQPRGSVFSLSVGLFGSHQTDERMCDTRLFVWTLA